MTDIRISIVTYNNATTIERCLDSVYAQRGDFKLSISVVDNYSRDNTAEIVSSNYADVELIQPGENLGFGAGHNRVLCKCTEPYAIVLNPDAWLMEGAVRQLLETLDKYEDVALVGPRMEYENGRPQLSFGRFPGLLADMRQRSITKDIQAGERDAIRHIEKMLVLPIKPNWISGSCFLARTKALTEVDYFDERFFLYLEDVDLCRRLRNKGWSVLVEPRAVCKHLEGHSHTASEGSRGHFRRSRLVYENKHGSRLGFFLYKHLRARNIDLKWDAALHQTDSL